ncbi:unnamed protein product [Lactuca saligna]|uniref:Uncharacterized protein n=1 Tax=Lactuca saligna TaxID=75948 RepID=A0AA35Z8Z5_LACSI|nr:unnamed protein product [Lactuca saligna]
MHINSLNLEGKHYLPQPRSWKKKVEESPTKSIQEKKRSKSPKKKPTKEVVVSKPKETPVAPKTDEPPKEVVPLKTGVFKRLKKIAHKSSSSYNRSPSISPSMIHKPHVTRKDTSTTLPSFVTTSLDTNSPTFDNILNQPITSLFSSQSTELPGTHEEAHHSSDDDESVFGGTFGDIQFDPEEENIPDNMILTGKKIQNPESEA